MIKRALLILALLSLTFAMTTKEFEECESQYDVDDADYCNPFDTDLGDEPNACDYEKQYRDNFQDDNIEVDWTQEYGENWHKCKNLRIQQYQQNCEQEYIEILIDIKECGGDFGVPLELLELDDDDDADDDDKEGTANLITFTLLLSFVAALII